MDGNLLPLEFDQQDIFQMLKYYLLILLHKVVGILF